MHTAGTDRQLNAAPSIRLRALAAACLFLVCLVAAVTLASSNLWSSLAINDVRNDDVPYLGITYVALSHDIAVRYGVGVESGLLVTEVSNGGPAAAAGLQRGDVIIAADEGPVSGTNTLIGLLGQKKPGDHLAFRVQRGAQTFTVDVLLTARNRT